MREKLIFVVIAFLSVSFVPPCASASEKTPAPQQQNISLVKNRDVQAVKPKKPVSIKLRRSASGQYSWDISGNNADDVYRADNRLRKLLKMEQ
jgi:hypothetical protein